MSQSTGTGGRQGYAIALADQWYALSRTLRRLEQLAGDLDEDAHDQLPALQYQLHVAGERIAGLDPPPGAAAPHDELEAALAEARDATAEVTDAFAHGGLQAASPLVWEWRGALFAVRLARQRLVQAPEHPQGASGAVRRSRQGSTIVAATLALPLLVVAAIAVAAGAETWTIAIAFALAAGLGVLLRRA